MNLYESIVKESTLSESSNDYSVVIGFLGGYGDEDRSGSKEYIVSAENKKDAVDQVLDNESAEAKEDVSIYKSELKGDEWEIIISFAEGDADPGFHTYTFDKDSYSKEDAERAALDTAIYDGDLYVETVNGEEFNYNDDSNFNETQKLIESTKKLIKKGERGDEPVALINWEGNYQPYVVAINYDENTGSWGYGYYYTDEELANQAFDWVCSGGNMHDFNPDKEVEVEVLTSESEENIEECNASIKTEGQYEDTFGEPASYKELESIITVLQSIYDKAEADGLHKVLFDFKKSIDSLSKIYKDLEEFYNSTEYNSMED